MKHFKNEAKWMIAVPLAILVVGFLLAVFVPYFR